MSFDQRQNCPLNLLGFVAGMLCVSPPGCFDECNGLSNFLGGTAAFQHEVQAVLISVPVRPCDFFARPCRPQPFLIQVKAVFLCEALQKREDSGLPNLADDLAEPVGW